MFQNIWESIIRCHYTFQNLIHNRLYNQILLWDYCESCLMFFVVMDLRWSLQMNKEINKDSLEIWIPFFQDLCNLLNMWECTVTAYHWAGFFIMTWLGWGELGSDVGSVKIFALRNSEAEFEIDHPLACRKYHFENAVLQFTLHRQKQNLKNCTSTDYLS